MEQLHSVARSRTTSAMGSRLGFPFDCYPYHTSRTNPNLASLDKFQAGLACQSCCLPGVINTGNDALYAKQAAQEPLVGMSNTEENTALGWTQQLETADSQHEVSGF